MTRLPAIVVIVIAIPVIIVGRVTHHTPIAIVGYALLAVAIVLGLFARR